MPKQTLLSVLYTRHELCVELSVMRSVYWDYPYEVSPPSMDYTVGSDKKRDQPNEEDYWAAVKDTISRGMQDGLRLHHRPELVFVFGESSEDPMFRSVLEDALRSALGEVPKFLDKNPHFQTAQGAAELAMRGGYM